MLNVEVTCFCRFSFRKYMAGTRLPIVASAFLLLLMATPKVQAQDVPAIDNDRFNALRAAAKNELFHGSALRYLSYTDSLLIEAGSDSLLRAIAHCEKGAAHVHLNDVGSAWPHLLEAFRYFRRNGPDKYVARCYGELARAKSYRGEFREAIEFFENAEALYLALGDTSALYRVLGNKGVMYAQLNQNDSARAAYQSVYSLAIARNDTMAMVPYYLNMTLHFVLIGELDSAETFLEEAWPLFSRFGDELVLSNAFTTKANIEYERGQYGLALQSDARAIELCKSAGAPNVLLNPYNRSAMSAEALGDYQLAHDFLKKYINLQDSLRNAERETLIASMESRFKLIEKEYEIDILTTESKSATRQKWLYVALFGMALVMLFALYVRSRKEKQLHRSQSELMARELEVERLQNARVKDELERATDALARDALQMIRKNDQLTQLRQGMGRLEQHLDKKGEKVYSQLQSLLRVVKNEDKSWDEFARLFEKVHPAFWQQLNQMPNPLTEKEKRLCALIKVNMQNREVAAVLGISPESVKTARYRLRKKLQIDSDQDLNQFVQML